MSSNSGEAAVIVTSRLLPGVEDCRGICAAPDGSLYVSRGNSIYHLSNDHKITLIAGSGTQKHGFYDGAARYALFNHPSGLLVTEDGSIYVCDSWNHCIRVIKKDRVTTFAGSTTKGYLDDADPLKAQFSGPTKIILHNNVFYVTDTNNKCIRTIQQNGAVSSILWTEVPRQGVSKNRTKNAHQISSPVGISVSPSGDKIAFSDRWTHRLFSFSVAATNDQSQLVPTSLAGTEINKKKGGYRDSTLASDAHFNAPVGITYDLYGNLLICDRNNHCIRRVDPSGSVSTVVGTNQKRQDGPLKEARTSEPNDICTLPNGDIAWVESDGSVRFMNWSCRRSVSLVALLEEPRYSDYPVTQRCSGTTFHLNREIIGMHESLDIETVKKVIEDSTVPASSVRLFLELYYGAIYNPLSPNDNQLLTVDAVSVFVHLIVLTKALRSHGWEEQVYWLEERLSKSVRRMESKLVESLLVDVAPYCLIHPPIVDIIVINYSKRRYFEELPPAHHQVKFGFLSPEIQAQILPKLDPEYNSQFTLSPHHHTAPLLRSISQGLAKLEKSKADWTISAPPQLHGADDASSSKGADAPVSEGEGAAKSWSVHEWLAFLRWPYFRRLILSGLNEVSNKHLDMPADFPEDLLESIIACIYRGDVDTCLRPLSIYSAYFALENAEEFGLCEHGSFEMTKSFQSIFKAIQVQIESSDVDVPRAPDDPANGQPKPLIQTQQWFTEWQEQHKKRLLETAAEEPAADSDL